MEVLSMGLPCEGGADCALRELSPSWGPPPQTRQTVFWGMKGWQGLAGKKVLSGNNARFGEESLIPWSGLPLLIKCPPPIQGPRRCQTQTLICFLFWLPYVFLLHIQKLGKNIHVIITEFKWTWIQLNVHQNSQNIYISFSLCDCLFIWNSLNYLKNHSRDSLF